MNVFARRRLATVALVSAASAVTLLGAPALAGRTAPTASPAAPLPGPSTVVAPSPPGALGTPGAPAPGGAASPVSPSPGLPGPTASAPSFPSPGIPSPGAAGPLVPAGASASPTALPPGASSVVAPSPGPGWSAFVQANDGIDDYTETVTTHEIMGTRTEARVYHFYYKKPHFARSEIISGPGAGGVAVWHGGDKVKGHQGGVLSGLKLIVSIHDPRATDIRGKTIEAANFGWIITGYEHFGKLSETPGPVIDGQPTDAVTLVPYLPSADRNISRDILFISRTSHLPVQHVGYQGDTIVENELFTDQKINVGLPASTFDL